MTYEDKVRIFLKDHAASKARKEWQTKLGNSEALATRVLLQEVINQGELPLLKQVAKYFNVHLPPENTAKPLPPGMLIATIGSQDKPEKIVIYLEKINK